MEECSDRDLVTRCRNGERAAFDQLIERHQPVMIGIVRRMVRDPEDARDIVQTVFLKAYENLDSFRTEMRFFSWLYRIAVNEAINFLEARRRSGPLPEDPVSTGCTPEREFDRARLIRTVETALSRLDPRARALIVLRHYAELSYRELGFIFDTPEQTIKSRLHGARRILARRLRQYGVCRDDLGRTVD